MIFRAQQHYEVSGLRGKYPGALEKMSADLMYLDNIREFLDDGDGIVSYNGHRVRAVLHH